MMTTSRQYACLMFLVLLAGRLDSLLQAADPIFKAGASKRDITPLEPVPMWGYGARHNLLSNGVLDPLLATVVVIQTEQQKLAIVGLDLGRSPTEASLQNIRQRIKTDAGVHHSFLAGSHTHHGPVVELTDQRGKGKGTYDAAIRYNKFLEDSIVAAIVEANQNLVPAKLATGTVELDDFNRNRQSKIDPRPVDRSLNILRLTDMDDKSIATVVNFTGHPTNVPGSTLKFSADYVGALRTTVEQALGGQAIFMQGASGDISVSRERFGDHIGYGQALGREILKLAATLKPDVVAKPTIKVREDRFRFASRTDLRNPFIMMAYSAAFFPELVVNFADEYADGIRPRLTVAVLNSDIAFVGASGEFFCQHANRLRERARVKHLFFFGYCNGYHQYFPTIEAVAEGGYGADSQVAPAEVGAGETVMNAALMWLYQLRGKMK